MTRHRIDPRSSLARLRGLAGSILLTTSALGATPQDAAPAAEPPEAEAVATTDPFGFDASTRTDEAKAKGAERIALATKAYHAAKTLTDVAAVTVESPERRDTDRFEFRFGPGVDAELRLAGARMVALDGKVTLIADAPADRVLQVPLDEDLLTTLRKTLPQFGLPAPQFVLRYREVATAADLSLDALVDAAVAGYREVEGRAEVLLSGREQGSVLLVFDATSNLLQRTAARFVPSGAPPTFRLALDITYTPAVHEALAEPIALDLGSRMVVTSLDAFMPKPLAVGDVSPDWSLKSFDGGTVRLRDLRGTVVVVDLWATWCAPCKRGLPYISEFAQWATSSGLPIKVFAINTLENGSDDEQLKKAGEWWSSQKFAMPLLLDFDDAAFRSYGLEGIPATIVIGPDGRIGAIHAGIDPKNPGSIVTDLKAESERLARPAGS